MNEHSMDAYPGLNEYPAWIRYLARLNIIVALAGPLLAFWAFGYTSLDWPHFIIPGELLGPVAFGATLISYFLYGPAVILGTLASVPREKKRVLKVLVIPLLIEIGVALMSPRGEEYESATRRFLMFLGTHLFCATTIAVVWHTFRNPRLRPTFILDFPPFVGKVVYLFFVVVSLFAVLLFQLAVLPLYLKGSAAIGPAGLMAAIWFAGLFSQTVSRISSKKL